MRHRLQSRLARVSRLWVSPLLRRCNGDFVKIPKLVLMNSRSIGVGVVISIGLGAIASLTNPERQDYQKYAVQILDVRLREFCQQSNNSVGEWLQNHCYTLVDTARPYLAATIERNTLRHNFVLFSIYQTNLPVPTVANYQVETVGIFNLFYTYKAEEL